MRNEAELFGISVLVLFLELACIRWFPAHVLFLTFFTNTVLLASFLGMSAGCLAASRPQNFLRWTPAALLVALVAAHALEHERDLYVRLVDVGHQASPQLVFFGTESRVLDPGKIRLPIEAICGFFFVLIALAMVGPGQELGRALDRIPHRVRAYTLNISGSLVGIALFAACSFFQLSPAWWFLLVALGTAYLLRRLPAPSRATRTWLQRGALILVVVAASRAPEIYTHSRGRPDEFWSPYYRIHYESGTRKISVNQIGHQAMVSRDNPGRQALAYSLPYLLRRDSGGLPFQDVLVIGAGSGNDVSRALQWGAAHVDAVEIDPVILKLGQLRHPDRPYQDGRVTVHLDDGRNFLRSTEQQYDLIVFALVDSLVLHSSYSNIRLESYLFTTQALADVRRHLRPGGVFVMYNYFRQGWIVSRLDQSLQRIFDQQPLVFALPYQARISSTDRADGFVMFMAGDTSALRSTFDHGGGTYWMQTTASAGTSVPNGFKLQGPDHKQDDGWMRLAPAVVETSEPLRLASDDWPFLYLRHSMIPSMSLRAALVMGAVALLLIWWLAPKPAGGAASSRIDARMFFLGAGFMLIETKAVVQIALVLGSTWMVNTIVFFAVLVLILAANLYTLWFRPKLLWPYYVGLLAMLGLGTLLPLDIFLGLAAPLRIASSSVLVLAPVLFAGVVFAVCFERSREPDRAFGANIAGAMAGGLSEYSSMLLGFRCLGLLAAVFYLASAVFGARAARVDSAVS